MNKLICAALMLLACAAIAQETRPPAEDLEPGVNTSAPPPSQAAPAAPSAPPASTAPASARAPAANNPGAAPAPNKGAARSNARDRLDLDSTQITGNRELPKVLYIVPWRNAELGDLVGKPVNSLLDEVLEPVDRDVFRRQNRYFEALQQDGAPPAGKPEK
jgi:hypothetical protein